MTKLNKVILLCAGFFLTLAMLPVLSLAMVAGEEQPVSRMVSQSSLLLWNEENDAVTVLIPSTGERQVMSETDYLCGVVASQMPPEYDGEAIKAQTVASYTLMKYRRIHAIPAEEQGFLSKQQMQKIWGEDYSGKYARMKALVKSVYGQYLAYDGAPILAAYHEMSCGQTEYGENIWTGEFPYLVPAESRDDICAEDFRSSVRLSAKEFSDICVEKLGIVPENEPQNWPGECVRSDSGYVLSYELCGVKLTGQAVRNAFGLRSACFTLKYEGDSFFFDVKGSGHGAGMSKFGANLMALGGKSYVEILAHYYKGAQLVRK